MTTFSRTAAVLAAVLVATPVLATGVKLDKASEAQIREHMTSQGYEVRKVATEDGMYEVYAMKDGKKYEMYLDGDLKVVKSVER